MDIITIKLDLFTTIPVMEWIKSNDNCFDVPYKVGCVFEDNLNSSPLVVTKIDKDSIQSIINFYNSEWFE